MAVTFLRGYEPCFPRDAPISTLRGFPAMSVRGHSGASPLCLAELSRTTGTVLQLSCFNGMSERVQACRRKAAECERAAVLPMQPDAWVIYHDHAHQWCEMADQAEELERLLTWCESQ
jgi:hypothetical protein